MTSSNKDEAISTTQLTLKVEDLSINDTDMLTITCANCGKDVINPNTCNKCKAATYCNASCKKKHRHKHKQDCEKCVAELHAEEHEREKRAAELHDEELYKQPLPKEDCPICMLLLPSLITGYKYSACCGKMICSGCIHAVEKRDGGVGLCPFCRTPAPTSDELVEQYKKRMELGDAEAIYSLGSCYSEGLYGMPQDHAKALELWHRAAELGHTGSYYNIGVAYHAGNGARQDMKKKYYYYELAAMGGDVEARHNLGCSQARVGNHDRALKHFMIAAGGGEKESLSVIQDMFKKGVSTKEDYTQALRAYQAYLGEIKSAQRDEAAAFSEEYKYYEV